MSGESALKLALKARAAREVAHAALSADPIAIVGLACRLPGSVRGPDDFWQLLREGRDVIRRVPSDRWDADEVYDPDLSAPGKSITREAGFLDRIDGFDADYFGILPREAEQMDPQQRLFLEVAIEALDDAGQPQGKLARTRTGVYVASYHNDYAKLVYEDADSIDLRSLTGTLHSVLANRLSWFLDLRGPSLSVDTACSSSLVAIHLACQSLRFGETDLAIAGGVSLIVTPDLMISMSKVGFMSPDGRSKTFDASANGFGRGEGCGVVVLKRLADAIADQDRVLAVIRGSVVNQDGRSTLLAAPSGPAQEELICEALDRSLVDADRIGLVEAHGTGTALGDPIEVEALAAAIGRGRASAGPCWLGSAKANIGHLEAAAGVTGLIKAVLALQHKAIPPQPNFSKISPHIDLTGTRFSIPTALTPWPANAAPRVAAVSSFGVGGTNAHVIIEEAPSVPKPAEPAHGEDRARLLPLSAKTSAALQELCETWTGVLAGDETQFADLCRTAGERRTHYPVRKAIVASGCREAERALADFQAEDKAPAAPSQSRVAFVFCGQGPQWHAMGRQLLSSEAVFREAMRRADAALLPLSGFSVIEELCRSAETTRLGSTIIAQPALFALQVALSAQLAHWGITPDAVVGHSVGELAALHVAGILDFDEATRIVWHRARLMQDATGHGRMASVSLTAAAAEEIVDRHPGLDIAAINAATSVVLSGDNAALDAALKELEESSVVYRKLPVDYAFHSAQMEPIQGALVDALGKVRTHRQTASVYSSVLGKQLGGDAVDAGYVGRNVREPVRFAAAAAAMLADGHNVVVEIGPHPVLGPALDEISAAAELSPRILAALRRNVDERRSLLSVVAGAYEAGLTPDWEAVSNGEGSVVSLPSYPWQRQRHWIAQRRSQRSTIAGPLLHPVLGRAVPLADDRRRVFDGCSRDAGAWLEDHRIFGEVVFPAAAVMEGLCKAAAVSEDMQVACIESFAIDLPIIIRDGEEARWQVVVEKAADAAGTLTLHVADKSAAGSWMQVAAASVATTSSAGLPSLEAPATGQAVDTDDLYSRFAHHGVEFGNSFRLLRDIRMGSGWARASIATPPHSANGHLLEPAILDAGLQLCTVAASAFDSVYLPIAAESIRIAPWTGEALAVVVRAALDGHLLKGDISIETVHGASVVRISGMAFARADANALSIARCETYVERWIAAPSAARVAPGNGIWLVYDDEAGTCARALGSTGANVECLTVRPGAALRQQAPGTWELDPTSPDDARRLFDLRPWGSAPLQGIVHAWALDTDAETRDLQREDQVALASLLHLVQAARLDPAPMRVVTRVGESGAQDLRHSIGSAGVAALARVTSIEETSLQLRVVEIAPEAVDISRLGREIAAEEPAHIALLGERRLTPRLRRLGPAASNSVVANQRPLRLVAARPGDLSGLDLVPFRSRKPSPDEVRIRILVAGLNFRDVLATLGLYPGSLPELGAECVSEVIERGADVTTCAVGDRVFGYVPGSLASEATVTGAFVKRVPEGIGDDQAATFPVAFATALYGLESLAGLQSGEHVLIHSAAGGVGLAAVQLALSCGAVVHATVGSAAKRDRLRAMGVRHLYSSRTLDFADEIIAATGGRGVEVALNSLAGPFVDASFRCLARNGRFLEIGKRDIWSSERAGTERPDVAYHAFDLASESERDPSLFAGLMESLCRRLTEGRIEPLPVVSFPLDRAADAMRTMAQARHIGKLAIRIADRGQPFCASSNAGYLVTGGLGALGLETAEWLIRSGARHLMLVGRGSPREEAGQRIAAWRKAGVDIRVEACDVANFADVDALFVRMSAAMPPLKGIVHAAGVLRDGTLASQQWVEACEALEGKVHGARHLDRLSRNLDLDFFILYSAAAVALGGAGQGLYTAANAELDALARQRTAEGLPALSVGWGLWSGLGMTAGDKGNNWAARGLRPLKASSAFAEMERLLSARLAHGVILDIDWPRFLERAPYGLDRSFFTDTAGSRSSSSSPKLGPAPMVSPLQAIRRAPVAEHRDRLVHFLGERIAQILGQQETSMADRRRPLKEYGIDSLMAVELRNLLARAGGVSLPATLLFDYPTLDALSGFLLKAWKLGPVPTPAGAGPPPARPKDDLTALSDTEIEDLLRDELKAAGGVS